MSEAQIAAVIPSWNTAAHLDRCLDALDAQEGVDLETLVIDNGSTDGSLAILERREVAHIRLAANTGFAAAVNLGAARTTSPLVLVLNADCFPEPACLRLLSIELIADPGLGGVQPRILQAGGAAPRIYSAGQGLTRYGSAFERGWGSSDSPEFDGDADVFGVSGAACLLRRELFAELGGYDESYFAFYEDVELNARARLAGWGFRYVAAARAVHVGHAGWRQEPSAERFNVELTVRNRLATALKTLPPTGVAGALVLTLRSLVAGTFRGTGRAALRGVIAVTRRLPGLLRERRRLRKGDTQSLQRRLAARRGAGPDPHAL